MLPLLHYRMFLARSDPTGTDKLHSCSVFIALFGCACRLTCLLFKNLSQLLDRHPAKVECGGFFFYSNQVRSYCIVYRVRLRVALVSAGIGTPENCSPSPATSSQSFINDGSNLTSQATSLAISILCFIPYLPSQAKRSKPWWSCSPGWWLDFGGTWYAAHAGIPRFGDLGVRMCKK